MTNYDMFEDEAPPTEDDMIKVHYLKHHPLYEFKNFEEFHIDPYRHWLHSRAEYYNTISAPAEIPIWQGGSPFWNFFFLLFPFLSFYFITNEYLEHLKHKNVKTPIVGVFSQDSV
mmetsp:Transcript_23706/g.18125  ORF Transcript_23706/g.18125 Transcript_23706/m.18125 type:complete len:115 (-) Transcript_23706:38-382(-)|eukprot:CAMPEP_0202957900 /NCGR_PEP_ID=MMETSP1396-20130829/2274_1 /ASSEMBLY_ACC=CAM_ASM_000872 /TAXON_ID= /ORGANISM="Pseudokeronopsis sp., Strain Brazil" /LENGTH=114 /DNA_ID=CAMNT_0049675635 /DNA_START=113 /DNA_END=457 /DNA_ORIENTATION=-